VPTEDDYGCSMPISSMDERECGIFEVCGCSFADGNTITPRQGSHLARRQFRPDATLGTRPVTRFDTLDHPVWLARQPRCSVEACAYPRSRSRRHCRG
jgi:hypothetical protein